MVVQSVAPGFTAASNKDKRDGSRSNTKSATSNIQWPEFKVSQPDPVLGKNLDTSARYDLSFVEVLQARSSLGRDPSPPSRL